MNKTAFILRYVIIPSNFIFGECGPHNMRPRGWSNHQIKRRNKATQNFIETQNRKNNFYNKLEASILKEGVRNPILVWAGWYQDSKMTRLPPKMKEDSTKILVCHTNGGSRLWIAQKHDLDIPCIVSDFVNRFSRERVLETDQDVLDCYKDKPSAVKFNSYGIDIFNLPQIHMEENK